VNPDLLRSSGCGEKAKIWLWLSSVRSQNAGKLRRCQALSDGICSKPFPRERRNSLLRLIIGVFIVLHGLVHLLYFGQSWRFFELQPEMVWPEDSWAFSRLL